MDCWSNTLSYSSLFALQNWQVLFLEWLFPYLVKAMSGRLVLFNGHGFVGMVCSELGRLRELATSVRFLLFESALKPGRVIRVTFSPGHPGLTRFTIYPGLTRIGSREKRNCSFDDVETYKRYRVALS